MIKSAAIILIALAVFLSMVINMALKKEHSSLNVVIALLGAIGGIIFYGYGYSLKDGSLLVAVPHTVLAVCGMFVGRWEVGNVEDAPLFSHPVILCLFLVSHFLAFYSLANVVMMRLGASLLKRMRIWLLRKNDLDIIYGVSDETIQFATRLREVRKDDDLQVSMLFVPDRDDSELARLVERNGWACRTDYDAVHPNRKFLKSLGCSNGNSGRKITLYALSKAENKNRRYASDLLDALNNEKIPAGNLSLTIYTDDIVNMDKMQALGKRYGYTDVNSFEMQSLTARLLTLEYPVYNTVTFNKDGIAQEDVDIFIAGFGSTGQAVLRSLVRNGQFEGSKFHAAVFASDIDSLAGRFFSVYDELCREYSIEFNRFDARSLQASDYVKQHAETLKYIIACTGNEETDWEIIRDLEAILGRTSHNILFLICGRGIVTRVGTGEDSDRTTDIWRNEILTASVADRAAKVVNASYSGNEHADPEQLWRVCSPFSRASCRAAADFMKAYCRISGISEEEAMNGNWNPNGTLLENMARTEHLRWNAFHRSMGWKTMSDEEFRDRSETYLYQKKNGLPLIRIAKNDEERHHACLVSWEDLERLSNMENAVTGGNVDYQQYDRDNVLAVPSLLGAFDR